MDSPSVFERPTLAKLARQDEACLRFEDEWKAGRWPRLEDFIASAHESERGELLHELLLVEWSYRFNRLDSFYSDEYVRRFPDLAAPIGEAWRKWKAKETSVYATAPPIPGAPKPVAPDVPLVPGFERVRPVGAGGMGVVYAGFDSGLRRWAALKKVRLQASSPEGLQRFRREALALARLRHPNIVGVYELRECDGAPLLVMEYVEGGTLEKRLPKGAALAQREAARLVAILARAMQHAHEKGIVHRDLKPDNVLMDAVVAGAQQALQGIPKIADLGLAGLCGAEGNLTQEGQVFGTPAYMAPEQAEGRTSEVGAPADVWALGVILYRCLTGVAPFAGDTLLETLERVKAVICRPLREVRPGVSAELEEACLACLRKVPRERPTAEELAERLERWCDGTGEVSPGEKDLLPRRPRRRKPVVVLAVCVAALCLLGMGLAWVGLRDKDGKDHTKDGASKGTAGTKALVEPLRVTLEVKNWETLRDIDRFNGVIGKKVFLTRVGQRVVLRVGLSEPGHCYLIAFNYDGKEQLLWPCKGKDDESDADQVPPLMQEVMYPPQAQRGLELEEEGDDKGGMQAFVVVCSPQALPPYRQWRALRKESPWRQMKAVKEVWRSDGRTLDPLEPGKQEERGKTVTLKGQPPLLEVCRWARGKETESVEAIVFGVLPKEVP